MKKNNKGLYAIIAILCIAVLGLGGFIVYDKFIKEDKKDETTEKEKAAKKKDNIKPVKKECKLTKLDSDYSLSESEKNEIANLINNHDAMNGKVDTDTIKFTKADGYVIFVDFKIINSQDSLTAALYKYDEKMVLLTFGSGYTNEEIEDWKETLASMCSDTTKCTGYIDAKYYGENNDETSNIHEKAHYTFKNDGTYTYYYENSEGNHGTYKIIDGKLYTEETVGYGAEHQTYNGTSNVSDDCSKIYFDNMTLEKE